MKTRTAFLTICALIFSLTVFGQSQETKTSSKNSNTAIDLQRTIRLEKDSKEEDVIITINQKAKRFELMISSSITLGKLTIELYDPNNIKQGNFTVGTQLDSEKKDTVNGNIRKSLNEPLPGNWKIKIIPTNASGNIKIQTAISKDDYYLHVPEILSPNGDNMNDIFKVETKNISDTIDFKIYNRFGKLVFESQNIDEGWNGMLNGVLQPVGSYYYVFRAKNLFGFEVVKNGPFYLTGN